MINNILQKDEDCQDKLPMNTEDDTLFHVFDNVFFYVNWSWQLIQSALMEKLSIECKI